MSRRTQKKAMATRANQIRETSVVAARALALTLVQGRAPGFQACDLGIVLNDAETAWQRAPARYQYRGESSWIVQHNSYWGYRSTISEAHQSCTFNAGILDWLVTDQRLATLAGPGQPGFVHRPGVRSR